MGIHCSLETKRNLDFCSAWRASLVPTPPVNPPPPPAHDGPRQARGEQLPSDPRPPGVAGVHCHRNRALDCTENEWKQLLFFWFKLQCTLYALYGAQESFSESKFRVVQSHDGRTRNPCQSEPLPGTRLCHPNPRVSVQLKISHHTMYSGWATTALGQHRAPLLQRAIFLVVDAVTVPPPRGMDNWGGVDKGGGRADSPSQCLSNAPTSSTNLTASFSLQVCNMWFLLCCRSSTSFCQRNVCTYEFDYRCWVLQQKWLSAVDQNSQCW